MKLAPIWNSRKWLALGAAVLVVGIGSGVAFAAGSSRAQAGAGSHPILGAITAELGIDAQQLATDLAGGQTLAQIATANGKSVSGLEQAILAGAQTRLDGAVAAGRLTSEAEQNALSRLSTRLDRLVNLTHPLARLRIAVRLRVGLLRLGAGYLGVTPQQLRSDLRSGKTLAQEAADNGKTASGLEQAIETALQARLDKAVAAGKLTAEREQTILSKLPGRLDVLLNHSFAG